MTFALPGDAFHYTTFNARHHRHYVIDFLAPKWRECSGNWKKRKCNSILLNRCVEVRVHFACTFRTLFTKSRHDAIAGPQAISLSKQTHSAKPPRYNWKSLHSLQCTHCENLQKRNYFATIFTKMYFQAHATFAEAAAIKIADFETISVMKWRNAPFTANNRAFPRRKMNCSAVNLSVMALLLERN